MASSKYITAPLPTPDMPGGVPYIIGNEAAERFSYYGMKAILFLFMTEYLLDSAGKPDLMTPAQANVWIHTFGFGVYFIPIIGAIIADAFLGKYRMILWLSIVYCFGHLALAIDDTRVGLAVGLSLIALGSGGIKPCVAAHVGDQFGQQNQRLLTRVFGWFYFSINIGSSTSMFLIPLFLGWWGPHVAFGIPGILMLLATIVFWMGRHKFVHIPAGGMGTVREAFSGDGIRAIVNLALIYVFVAMFWSLFEQTATSWIDQGNRMEALVVGGVEISAAQMQSLNPVLVMIFIPLFNYVVYPVMERFVRLTPLRKISFGMFITAASFASSAWIEMQLAGGRSMNLAWQCIPYVVLTISEIFVSITAYEFAYTQAPPKMKSFIMSFFLLSISGGNAFTALVNYFIQNEDGSSKLEGPAYFWFFAGTMFAAAVLFVFVAIFYRGQTYIQAEAEPELGESWDQ